jgi:antitoxin (DNA-binding transcriptional repressor) of toxin-antitoxin stability system
MEATVLDLRKNMKGVLAALGRNERVTLTHRGRKRGVIVPCGNEEAIGPAEEHEAFGVWRNREDVEDVNAFVRNLRGGRQL